MPTKVYIDPETTIVYGSEVGDDVAWTTESVSDDAGRISAVQTITEPAHRDFWWSYKCQHIATPTLRSGVRLRHGWGGNGAPRDHSLGTADAAFTDENRVANCQGNKTCLIDQATANAEFSCRDIHTRLGSEHQAIMFNDGGVATTSDEAETKGYYTPIPDEIQD